MLGCLKHHEYGHHGKHYSAHRADGHDDIQLRAVLLVLTFLFPTSSISFAHKRLSFAFEPRLAVPIDIAVQRSYDMHEGRQLLFGGCTEIYFCHRFLQGGSELRTSEWII